MKKIEVVLLYCLSDSNLSEDIAFVGWLVADLVRKEGATRVIRQQTQRQSDREKVKNFKEVRDNMKHKAIANFSVFSTRCQNRRERKLQLACIHAIP